MKVSLPDELSSEVKNSAARMGVRPQVAARAAVRMGLDRLQVEDVERELNPRDRVSREQRLKAKEALQWIRR